MSITLGMLVRSAATPAPGLAPVDREAQLRTYLGHSIRDVRQVEAFLLREPKAAVTYGSHRPKPGDVEWEQTSALGAALALAGTSVRTGAGPGVMSAAPAGFALGSSACDYLLAHTQGIHLAGLRVESKVSPHIARENFIRLRNFRYREQGLILNNVKPGESSPGAAFPMRGGLSTLQELVHEVASMQATGNEKPIVMDSWWKPTVQALFANAPLHVTRNFVFENDPQAMAQKLIAGPALQNGIDVRAWSKTLQKELALGLPKTLQGAASPVVICGARGPLSAEAEGALSGAAALLTKAGVGLRLGQSGALADAVVRGARSAQADATVDAYLDAGEAAGPDVLVRHTFTMKPAQQDVLLYGMGALVVSWPGDPDTLAALFATITEIRHNKRPALPIVITGDLEAARQAWATVSESRSERLGDNTDAAKDAFYGVTFSNDPQVITQTVTSGR